MTFNTQDLLKICCQQVKENLQFINVPIEKEFKFVCQECDSSSHPHYLLPSPDGIHSSCERKKRDYRNFTDTIIKREKTSENIQQGNNDCINYIPKLSDIMKGTSVYREKKYPYDCFMLFLLSSSARSIMGHAH